MKRFGSIAFSVLFLTISSFAQEFTKAIEDNSFFIEEAYNQEVRVVQHISTAYYDRSNHDFIFSFTQEWPAGGQTHQLSYTIPYQSLKGGQRGLGDVLLNYRYQLWAEREWGWIAPRLSVILPTGKSSSGLGNGVVGVQACVPLSKRWTDEIVTHFNVGLTLLPGVKSTTIAGTEVRKTLASYYYGASGIWLASPTFNLMCELLQSADAGFDSGGSVTRSTSTILSPGVRVAINLGSLQIVPGMAFPFLFSAGNSSVGVYAYLSFEHPY